jgi:hypothetical protein
MWDQLLMEYNPKNWYQPGNVVYRVPEYSRTSITTQRPSCQRKTFVQWLSVAWEEFFAEDGQAQVLSAFQRCGVSNAADGSEDNLIKNSRM